MTIFKAEAAYFPPKDRISLLPFRFERVSDNRLIVTNLVGDLLSLTQAEFDALTNLEITPGDGLFERAWSAMLIGDRENSASLQVTAARLRSRMSFLREPTALHILVVTLRCEHSCPYCQVSRQSTDKSRFDMSPETALRSVEIAMTSPARNIKLEFQGGEPLLNFDLIRHVVPYARSVAAAAGKNLQMVITSNLALLDDDILAFCKENSVLLSTSLDGPADLHNRNRPRKGGNSHELAVTGIRQAQAHLGSDHVGALMTTTEASLDRVEEIVDEYIGLGLGGIFLRPLSPYGFAVKTKYYQRYDITKWLSFYERGLRYIIKVNQAGRRFPEFYTAMMLQRMLTDRPTGYVDLRSPAGTGLGALVYNYDGEVYASDEARMLAEMGDKRLALGHVAKDDLRSMLLRDDFVSLIATTMAQAAPQCSSCAFQPFCGSDPTYHYATQGDPVGIKPLSQFCHRQKGVIGLLADILEEDGEDAATLRSWLN